MRGSPSSAAARPGASTFLDLGDTFACPRCGLAAPWGALARVEVLEGAALESHLAVRPDGWFVEVRACRGCGHSCARRVRAGATNRRGAGDGARAAAPRGTPERAFPFVAAARKIP
jgi:hypothetical protein